MKKIKLILILLISVPLISNAQTYPVTTNIVGDDATPVTTIGAGAIVTIDDGASLTCAAALDFQGNNGIVIVSSGGELILTGAAVVNNISANIIVEQGGSMRTDATTTFATEVTVGLTASTIGYSMVSPPISNATFGGAEYEYSESTVDADDYGTWTTVTGGNPISAGSGYATYEDGTITFIGTPNVAAVNLSLSITSKATRGTNSGHHLIGNPYTAAIDMNAFFALGSNTANTFGSYYIWNPANNSNTGGYDTYTGLAGEYLSTGQAFFIQLDYTTLADGNHTISFDPSIQVADNNTAFFRSSLTEFGEIKLNFSNGSDDNNKLTFRFDDSFTNDFDKRYDAHSVAFTEEGSTLRVSAISNETNYDIIALPLTGDITIPISLLTTDAYAITTEVLNYSSLPEGYKFELVNLDTNEILELSAGAKITSNMSKFDNQNGFELIITAPEQILAFNDKQNDVVIYNVDRELMLKNLGDGNTVSTVLLYSLSGNILNTWNVPANTNEFSLPLSGSLNGLYLVKVQNNNGQFVKKIVLR